MQNRNRLTALLMAALIGLTPLASVSVAQAAGHGPQLKTEQGHKAKAKTLKRGQRYAGSGQRVTNYKSHGLKAPRKGYRWVRDGNNYVLVAISTGIIQSIMSSRR